MHASPPASVAPTPSFYSRARSLVWAHRRKLASVVAAYSVGRSCPYWPEWAHPLCELLTTLLGAFDGMP